MVGGAVGFILANAGIAVFGWTDDWQWQLLLAGPFLAGVAVAWWRSRGD
jgi:hypothetical protein